MDHVMHVPHEICEDSSNPIASDGVIGGNSSNLIESETVIETRSGESGKGIGENSSDQVVSDETVIEVRSDEECECVVAQGMDSNAVENVVENSKEMVKIKVQLDDDDDYYSSGESNGEDPLDGDQICRICHLSSGHGPATMDLIELGCSCRGELGAVHRHCAETWFKLKGNRCCEICGETAKNITGVGDMRFMEEWNEGRSLGNSTITSSRGRCWQGHRLCNLLMDHHSSISKKGERSNKGTPIPPQDRVKPPHAQIQPMPNKCRALVRRTHKVFVGILVQLEYITYFTVLICFLFF